MHGHRFGVATGTGMAMSRGLGHEWNEAMAMDGIGQWP